MNAYPIQYDDILNKCDRCKPSWFSKYLLPNFCNKCGDMNSEELKRIKEKIKNETRT